jgi:transposase-like protein
MPKEKMKCPDCEKELERIEVSVGGASKKAVSWQCGNCGYVKFDKESSDGIIKELREKEAVLKMKQKLIKLSHDRLGIYLNKDVIRSLNLRAGAEIFISVPDKNKIIIEF